MTKHVHAELMMQYAQDAMETDKPWERWQFYSFDGVWCDCVYSPSWCYRTKYRRKQRTININGHEVPEPLRTAPCVGATVYYPCLSKFSRVNCNKFWDTSVSDMLLELGLLHSTREAAEIHAKALLSFTAKGVSDE